MKLPTIFIFDIDEYSSIEKASGVKSCQDSLCN